MDVVRWKLVFRTKSGNSEPNTSFAQPGVALIVDLKCRVCDHIESFWHAATITPKEVDAGHAIKAYSADISWFKFSVESRLAQQRTCDDCGTCSVIPKRYHEPLIARADSAMSQAWLRRCVEELNVQVVKVPESECYNAFDAYYAPGNLGVISQDWHIFSYQTVTD
jgi:hypothetical protein